MCVWAKQSVHNGMTCRRHSHAVALHELLPLQLVKRIANGCWVKVGNRRDARAGRFPAQLLKRSEYSFSPRISVRHLFAVVWIYM
jgi:hypothetical protein